jgi:sulfite reductase (NADPH) hemoprotein beta-component
MLVQRDYGDRTNRKHARLKYTIEDRGIDWFRGEVEKRVGYNLQPSKAYKFTSNGDRYGWHQQTDGSWSFTLFIQNGRIKDTPDYKLKAGLREIAKVHTGEFALTPNQHLIITKIKPSEKSVISTLLAKYRIDNNGLSGLRLNSMACVALPTCALAMAESERYLPSLIEKIEKLLEENGLRDDAITIRMTGCPNGCARPSIAEIAFIGKGFYNVT